MPSGDPSGALAPLPVEALKLQVDVVLPHAALGNVRKGVKALLAAKLMRYEAAMEGVLLSYSSVKFLQASARLVDEQPFVKFPVSLDVGAVRLLLGWVFSALSLSPSHLVVRGQAVVFRPVIGARMTGTVTKISPGHVGLLVCGLFNASVAERDMNGFYTYERDAECWCVVVPCTIHTRTPSLTLPVSTVCMCVCGCVPS